jgi:DNA-binding transcriptional LysR family regulator
MSDIAQPTLDHLRIFLEVVEQGSFGRAARKLGRAVSVVSYAIATLEAQLGVTLFDREGSRRPLLTEAGRALAPNARDVADAADALIARMRGLHQGLEAELALAVDVMVPGDMLAQLLRDFQEMFPTVTLRLHVEALGAVAALVVDGLAALGIAGPEILGLPELESEDIGSVELVPVAVPSHPLARAETLAPGEARDHLQLVLTDRSPLTEGQEFAVFGTRTWRLADLSAKHQLLRQGIGWGNMPRHLVNADLATGALVELALPERRRIAYRLHALRRRDMRPGPSASWVLAELRKRLSSQQ